MISPNLYSLIRGLIMLKKQFGFFNEKKIYLLLHSKLKFELIFTLAFIFTVFNTNILKLNA